MIEYIIEDVLLCGSFECTLTKLIIGMLIAILAIVLSGPANLIQSLMQKDFDPTLLDYPTKPVGGLGIRLRIVMQALTFPVPTPFKFFASLLAFVKTVIIGGFCFVLYLAILGWILKFIKWTIGGIFSMIVSLIS